MKVNLKFCKIVWNPKL